MTKTRLAAIKDQIATYEKKYGRDRGSVSLIAVSKKQTIDNIREAYLAGQRLFGENYLQEALEKMELLHELDIEWHFIGPIQSNKTRKIAENFHWAQSVDSLKIAERLSNQRPDTLPPLNILLEINVSQEASKSGMSPEEAEQMANKCSNLPGVKLRGLMAIPAQGSRTSIQGDFKKMHALWQQLRSNGYQMDILSMGMTGDFESAIAEGANMVRIGTAIFGKRI